MAEAADMLLIYPQLPNSSLHAAVGRMVNAVLLSVPGEVALAACRFVGTVRRSLRGLRPVRWKMA